MSSVLCLTLRFLDPVPRFHGRGDDGDPEWPPSPLRFFQALVSAAATRWRESQFQEYARPALQSLEKIQPSIVTPRVSDGSFGYRMYVPNNSGDLMTAAWARGDTETSMAKFRVEKDVRPTHLRGGDAVHYLFSLADGACPHFDVLAAAARSITHLGWGVDMVAGNASIITDAEAAQLPGERWLPADGQADNNLRVPQLGTLDDLIRKHGEFLNRLSNDGFRPVPPLSAFRVVGYRRATEPARRSFAAFEIWKPLAQLADLPAGKSKFRPFDTARHLAKVAGMVRHAAAEAAKTAGWSDDKLKTFILGHGDGNERQATTNARLMFLPLPSIMRLRVESIRRLLVVGPTGSRDDIQKMRQILSGRELVSFDRPEPEAMLSVIPTSDRNVMRYTNSASVWTTVTPVVLPGYDDPRHLRRRLSESTIRAEEQKRLLEKMDARIDGLLRKAIRQAGFSEELARNAEIDWRTTGFLPGVDLASRYCLPEHLKRFSRYHVKITWRDATGELIRIPGPIAIGGGRFGGFGVFAAGVS